MTIERVLLRRPHVRLIAMLVGLTLDIASASGEPILQQLPQARLFAANEKLYGGIELVAGNIDYIAEKGAEGYRPRKKIALNGSLTQKVYDYPSNLSALFVFEDLKMQLLKNRFVIVHECAGIDCGDVDGWRLFLHRFVAGNGASQHYLLAKQPGRGGDQYAQVHTMDIGSRPRAVVSLVKEISHPRYSVTTTNTGRHDPAS